jgi:hypothetical protein
MPWSPMPAYVESVRTVLSAQMQIGMTNEFAKVSANYNIPEIVCKDFNVGIDLIPT